MLALLVADDPRRSADRILTRLIQIHQAQGGAILRPFEGRVEIWLSAGLSLGAVSELPVRWTDHREALEAGRSVVEGGYALLPAMLGERLVAALYFAQPASQAVADARLFGTAIAQAVAAAQPAEGQIRVQEVSPTEEARLQLLSLLERHEWNIAEVARLIGVTRRTVYMRLRSFGIDRKRVPKIYKKMPVEA
jgi:transcriptional regulator with GAF, ATPase, and Fis domain